MTAATHGIGSVPVAWPAGARVVVTGDCVVPAGTTGTVVGTDTRTYYLGIHVDGTATNDTHHVPRHLVERLP